MSQHIAFIGLGNMGSPMARNLLKAGYRLTVYDLSSAAMKLLAAEGATAAPSPTAAVEGADIVISMLPASVHVHSLYLGQQGILPHISAGTMVIDCSTIAASTAQTLSNACAARNVHVLDAPVSGGTTGAEAGSLTFMVGGSVEVLERARPVLYAMGKNIFHAGGNGAGQVAKICNNMLLGILMAGTSEALALGAAHGLDPHILSDIMSKSSGRNWALEQYNPYPGVMDNVPAARGYQGGFGVDLMYKDLGLAAESAIAARCATPLGELARNLYGMHSLSGAGAKDFSSIIEPLLRVIP